jgi:hypothetical protein
LGCFEGLSDSFLRRRKPIRSRLEGVQNRSNPYFQPVWIAQGWPAEVTPVVEKLYDDANEAYGTDLKYK